MGEPTKSVIYRPTIINNDMPSIKYRYKNRYVTAVFNNDKIDYPHTGVAVDFAKGFREYAFKNPNVNKGNITRKDGLKIIQNIFMNNYNTESYGLGSGHAGALTEAKHIFDIYTDKDSDGGEMLTQQEQSEILYLYTRKYGSIKKVE